VYDESERRADQVLGGEDFCALWLRQVLVACMIAYYWLKAKGFFSNFNTEILVVRKQEK
jgi:hypothetical protein